MSTVAVSGGFDPLHPGHLRMFKQASKLGTVIVILNSDDWLRRKKGFVFMPWKDRAEIVHELMCVEDVIPVDDADGTVCEALRQFRPTYFANGGDRTEQTTPELALCTELGIKPIFGIGGGKVASSSALVQNARHVEIRPWGAFSVLHDMPGCRVKTLTVNSGQRLSMQRHAHRTELWACVSGTGKVDTGEDWPIDIRPGADFKIRRNQWHRLSNTGNEPLVIIETQIGEHISEDDIERAEDDYGRVSA